MRHVRMIIGAFFLSWSQLANAVTLGCGANSRKAAHVKQHGATCMTPRSFMQFKFACCKTKRELCTFFPSCLAGRVAGCWCKYHTRATCALNIVIYALNVGNTGPRSKCAQPTHQVRKG
jgi:hypothetical protein